MKQAKLNKKVTPDGDSAVDRLVEESKQVVVKEEEGEGKPTDDAQSNSSFSSYDTIEGTGRYKCRACLLSFKSKKLLEKHRKLPEHKKREKKYSEDHAKQMQINQDKDVKFETTFKMACPECGKAF